MKAHASSRVNPFMSASTSSFGYESSSLISFVKVDQKKHRKSSPSVQVNVVNIDTTTKERLIEPETAITNDKRCPLALTVTFGILALLCLIALIVTVCVLLLVPKTSTTTSLATTVITTTSTTTTSTLSSNTTVGLPPLYRWNSTGITVAGAVATPGTTANRLNIAYGLALDSSNTLYIADNNNNRIQKWLNGSVSGTTVAGQASGISGTNASFLQNPSGLAVDSSGNVYVADSFNQRMQLWLNGASSGTTIGGTGIAGSSNNQFSFPYAIALDSSSGTLYITDQTNHRVMRYFSGATTGSVVAGNNGAGTNTNQLSSPCGLYFDSSTNSLIIANFAANNIVRWPIGANSWTLVAGNPNGISGNTATLLNSPMGVVSDAWGNIYVADTYNQRIQFFLAGQSNGTTIAGTTSTLGSTASLFRYPYALVLDNQLNVYVSDTYNFRVQKFLRY